jgi:hypothetical protein
MSSQFVGDFGVRKFEHTASKRVLEIGDVAVSFKLKAPGGYFLRGGFLVVTEHSINDATKQGRIKIKTRKIRVY